MPATTNGSTRDRPPSTAALNRLVVGTAQGDAEAFSDLYGLTIARVFGLAERVLRDAAQAEEITQEAYLHLWKHAARFDPVRGNVMSWLSMIAHGLAVDRVRSSESRVRREAAYQRRRAGNRPAEDETFEIVSCRWEARGVRTALEIVSAAKREAIELAYFEGFTAAEVARVLGVPVSTAKTRIRDGLLALRAVLEEMPEVRGTEQ